VISAHDYSRNADDDDEAAVRRAAQHVTHTQQTIIEPFYFTQLLLTTFARLIPRGTFLFYTLLLHLLTKNLAGIFWCVGNGVTNRSQAVWSHSFFIYFFFLLVSLFNERTITQKKKNNNNIAQLLLAV
jgi:hypothetical protein